MAVGIRPARPADAASIASIYAHYVQHSIVTFEVEPPSTADITARLAFSKSRGLECFVAETEDKEIVGYAYGRPYNAQRPGYDCTVELTVYLRHIEPMSASPDENIMPSWMGKGLGRRLVTELFDSIRTIQVDPSLPDTHPVSQSQRYLQVIAGQARPHVPGRENGDVKSFYRTLGFRHVGTLIKAGYKLGVWVDVDLWQLDLETAEYLSDSSVFLP